MKKSILITLALLLSVSQSYAAEGGKVALGVLGMAAGAGVWVWAKGEADDKEKKCERENSSRNVIAVCSATPGLLPIGAAVFLGGAGLFAILDGLTDDKASAAFEKSGVSFGFIGSGGVGIQKKWEF